MMLCLDGQFSEQELSERDELDLRNVSANILNRPGFRRHLHALK